MITLEDVAAACGDSYRVHRLGGNVYGVTDYRRMITLDGGVRETVGDTASLWITESATGADVFTSTITRAPEVPLILATLEA